MNEEEFRKLHEEYKRLKAETSPNSSPQEKGKPYEYIKFSPRFLELKRILKNEYKEYPHLLSAGDRFDILE